MFICCEKKQKNVTCQAQADPPASDEPTPAMQAAQGETAPVQDATEQQDHSLGGAEEIKGAPAEQTA